MEARFKGVYGWEPGRGLSDDDGVAILVHGNPVPCIVAATTAEVAGIEERPGPAGSQRVQLCHKSVAETVVRALEGVLGWEVTRTGDARDVDMAGAIDGDG